VTMASFVDICEPEVGKQRLRIGGGNEVGTGSSTWTYSETNETAQGDGGTV